MQQTCTPAFLIASRFSKLPLIEEEVKASHNISIQTEELNTILKKKRQYFTLKNFSSVKTLRQAAPPFSYARAISTYYEQPFILIYESCSVIKKIA